MSNKIYDTLKWIVQIALPAFAALYFGLSQIWNLLYPEEIVGTVAVVTTFLGTLLGLSSRKYNKSDARFDGEMVVDTSGESSDIYRLELDMPIDSIADRNELVFKVNKPFE